MGKYSSDSENEKRRSKISNKSRNRRRSSSTDSGDNIGKRRKDKRSGRKSKSRSREKYSKSRRSRSSSESTYHSSKSKRSISDSKDRSRYKSRRRSKSRSRDAYKSHRSRSKSYIREYVSKQKKCGSSSSSSSDDQSRKEEKRTRSTYENVRIKNRNSPDCRIVPNEVLDEINEDKFVQKNFSSNKSKKVLENIVIDLKKNTIKVPEVEPIEPDSIFHHNLFLNEEARIEKWVKELYSYRQKALQQGLKNISKI